MFPQQNPTQTAAWKRLEQHFSKIKNEDIAALFAPNQNRFEAFCIQDGDFLFDFSKTLFTEETKAGFAQLFEECRLHDAMQAQQTGALINATEKRAVLHTALRAPSKSNINFKGENISQKIEVVLQRMELFAEKIRSGKHTGHTGKRIKNIVNIGIGGSDLGPKMATAALKDFAAENLHSYFVSNIDGDDINDVLATVNREETLFVISSKSFTTQETMANAETARKWFLKAFPEEAIAQHFVAVSTNTNEVKKFGIATENQFEFWDWVGGRYSVWSAIGLPLMIAVGPENFRQFLAGAHAADNHFFNHKFEDNIPMMMAALGIWHRNFFNFETHAILPYSQRLQLLPMFLQQADMESNGKAVDRNGKKVNYKTGPIIWGQPGTNGQHAFYQLLHQGTATVPADFIAFANENHPLGQQHEKLLANVLAQTEALMLGKNEQEACNELKMAGKSDEEINALLPYKIFEGNKPTCTILAKKLTPFNLGKLMAFYEHKIFVQGVIWNIFSFDQWGVELGKQLAKNILPDIESATAQPGRNASTNGLLQAIIDWRKN